MASREKERVAGPGALPEEWKAMPAYGKPAPVEDELLGEMSPVAGGPDADPAPPSPQRCAVPTPAAGSIRTRTVFELAV